jgi:uncharacterized iron-regulated membrane protein
MRVDRGVVVPRREAGAPRAPRVPTRPRREHRLTRTAFYAHLWLGVLFTVVLALIAVTGILLNHKRGLGLMPDVAHAPSGPIETALPISRLADLALRAAPPGATIADVDRMDVRPSDGFVKVRLRDPASTEVTLDLVDGRVLHVGPRGDAFMEKLHSGEALGDGWVLLSDAAAVALVVLLVSGYWLWLAPKRTR